MSHPVPGGLSAAPRIGVLIGQVGTPSAPTPRAVRRYLSQFLSDQRVVDYSPWLWRPLLYGVILPTRSPRSAALYRNIWTEQGSPLLTFSKAQRTLLQRALGDRYLVLLGMAYDGPRFVDAVDEFVQQGIDRVVVLPMFPQYSSATTASIYDAVAAATTRTASGGLRRRVPAIAYVAPFYDHPCYITSVAARVRACIADGAAPDHIVMSFHGLPERYCATGDPYREHCERTATLLAAEMGWTDRDYTICFQSRFGRERWLEPDTAGILRGLPARGIKRPLVITPGFTTDCLETLDELGREGREIFHTSGGEKEGYRLCPCLNDSQEWIECMRQLVERQTGEQEGRRNTFS